MSYFARLGGSPWPDVSDAFAASGVPDLVARGITRVFGETVALWDAGLAAGGGELIAVVGPNGSGKTTLLRIVAGLERADRGVVLWSHPPDRIAYVGHHAQLFGDLTVRETMDLAARIGAQPRHQTLLTSDRAFLVDHADQPVASLSAGMRRRLALLRAFVSHPSVLIIDEPFAALDPAARTNVAEAIEVRRSQGGLVIISGHESASMPCTPTRVVRLGGSSDDAAP